MLPPAPWRLIVHGSPGRLGFVKNKLRYGDNLDILRERIPTESVDLIYLDPPFNSNRSYNVLFKSKSGDDSMAQIEAFDDTWTWAQESEELYFELISGAAPLKVAEALEAMRKLLGDNDMLAYLVMMTARQRAEMGVLITMHPPTRGMKDAARTSGSYDWTLMGHKYPKVQIISIPDLFKGKAVDMPTPMLPYVKAPGFAGYQGNLFA